MAERLAVSQEGLSSIELVVWRFVTEGRTLYNNGCESLKRKKCNSRYATCGRAEQILDDGSPAAVHLPAKSLEFCCDVISASELYIPSDHRLSAKLVPAFADRGRRVVSASDPYGRIFVFLDHCDVIKTPWP
jgi:hypothetical protein